MSFHDLEKSDHEGSKVELYLFETDDGLFKWRYTTDRKAINALGGQFIPHPIQRTALRQNAGEAGSERATIKVPFDNPVAVLHVPYLPPRPVKITIYSYQRRDLSVEIIQGYVGYITNFAQKGVEAEFLCSQIIDSFQQSVPWAVFHENCIWATYEEGCGVDREPFRRDATVLSSAAESIEAAEFAAEVDGWFTAGYATNPLNGETRFITQHIGSLIKVVAPFTDLKPGAVLRAYAGDDRTEATCRTKFNNKIRYVGFDHFPNYNVFAKGST